MKTCSEKLLWYCQGCGNPFELEEWEKGQRGCPLCERTEGQWKCSSCQKDFGQPSLGDEHPCLKNESEDSEDFLPPPQIKSDKATFVFAAFVVIFLFILFLMGGS